MTLYVCIGFIHLLTYVEKLVVENVVLQSCQLYLGVIFGTITLQISKVSPSESFVEIQGRGLVMGFIIVVFSL